MTSFLTFLVVILVALTFWQLSKVLNIYQASKKDTLHANDEDNKTQGNLMLGFLIFLFVFVVYGLFKWGHLVLGKPASEHGVMIDNLMAISWVVIFAVFFLTQFLLHYFAFKYQGKEGRKALYFSDSNKLEMIWTIIPVITLAGLILYGLYGWNQIMSFDFEDEKEAPMVVELYAQQFNWTARYGGADNTLGNSNVRLINPDAVNMLGLDTSDPNYADDIIVKELHLPVGKKIHFKMRSQDVLHSAYMPHFRAQMNCVPGMVTEFSFTPTVTTAEMREDSKMIEKISNINKIRAERRQNGEPDLEDYEFDYVLICNKICGKSHYNMQLKIVVDTPEEFEAWMKKQKTAKEVIASN